tara:strand:+ start:244 stop:435 length:192 start_codon:yes stop_codon:yes gene_type:complete
VIATEHANGMVKTPASDHGQVQPGLRCECTATDINVLLSKRSDHAVGHVPHGIHADALEQSEA